MSSEVVLVGRAELDAIYQSLKKMQDQAQSGAEELATFGKRTQENLDRQTKNTENNIKKTGSLLRRMAGQLYSDFKALASLEALQGGLKLSSQFKGAISDSITLSDTIRRLGASFGIAKQDFGSFQGKLARGLGDIGASSEAAAQALEGLTGLGVKGEKSIMGLTKGAVQLAGISGARGQEKSISGLLGRTLQAQGKDINDAGAQKALIGEVTAASVATGKSAAEILGAMEQMFSTMDKGMRQRVGVQGMAQMAVMASTVGPAATKALQEYMSKSSIDRLAMDAQGFNVMNKDGGINMEALKKFVDGTRGRIGGDPRKSLMTAGFSEEAAEGLVRLADQSKAVAENMVKLKDATRDTDAAYRSSMGMMDAFKGAINTVKGRLEELTGGWTQKITDFLSNQVGDVGGSAAVVAGGATLAAVLAGGGLRGIGKGLLGKAGGMAQKEGYESITGEKVTPVYVVNANEIGGALGATPALAGLGKLGGLLAKGGALAAAGIAGYMIGDKIVNPALDKYTQGETEEGFKGNVVERLFFKLDKLLDGRISGVDPKYLNNMKVVVETKEPNLRAKTKVSRGASN